MPRNEVPPRSAEEAASIVGDNIRIVLAEQNRNLEWLAAEIGISVHSMLKAFTERVEMWLVFDASFYLGVAPDRLTAVSDA